MPFVDVTGILFDPDVAGQGFIVLRRQETVNNYGESTWTTERIQAIGSVTPSGSQELMREDAYDAQAKSIKIATTFRLRGVAKGPNASRFKPDIVLWNDNYFEVISPDDWTPFGAGFVDVELTSVHYVDNPPDFLPPWRARLDFSVPQNSVLAHGAGAW